MEHSVKIDQASCKRCQTCKEVCPSGIFTINDRGEVVSQPDKFHLCLTCGQCMAVCSSKSVYVNGFTYESDFFDLPETPAEGYEHSFFNLIRSRRAIRNFKDKPVPKEILEKIVEAIRLAPPGFPPVKVSIVVVSQPECIRAALPYMIDLYDQLLKILKSPLGRFLVKRETGKQKFMTMQNHLIPAIKSRMPGLKNGTEDTLMRNAQALILFTADEKGEDIQHDTLIAATYAMLACHSLGLGSSIMDIIPPAINKKKELQELFHIPQNHIVLSSLILGFPKYRYKRGIKRNLRSVEWI